MLDTIVTFGAKFFTWMFVIGIGGCVIVIPVAAYRMFSVLFETDQPGEK